MTSGANRLRLKRGRPSAAGNGNNGNGNTMRQRSFEREAQDRANLTTTSTVTTSTRNRTTKCSDNIVVSRSNASANAMRDGHGRQQARKRIPGEHNHTTAANDDDVDDETNNHGHRLGLVHKRSIKASKLLHVHVPPLPPPPLAAVDYHSRLHYDNGGSVSYHGGGYNHASDEYFSSQQHQHHNSHPFEDQSYEQHEHDQHEQQHPLQHPPPDYFHGHGVAADAYSNTNSGTVTGSAAQFYAPEVATYPNGQGSGSTHNHSHSPYYASHDRLRPSPPQEHEQLHDGGLDVHRILPTRSWHEENQSSSGYAPGFDTAADAHTHQHSPFYNHENENSQYPPTTYDMSVPTPFFRPPVYHHPHHPEDNLQSTSQRDEHYHFEEQSSCHRSWPDPERKGSQLPQTLTHGHIHTSTRDEHGNIWSPTRLHPNHHDHDREALFGRLQQTFYPETSHSQTSSRDDQVIEPMVMMVRNPFDDVHQHAQAQAASAVSPSNRTLAQMSLNGNSRFARYDCSSPGRGDRQDRNLVVGQEHVYDHEHERDSTVHDTDYHPPQEGTAYGQADSNMFEDGTSYRSVPAHAEQESKGITQFQKARHSHSPDSRRNQDYSKHNLSSGTTSTTTSSGLPFHIPHEDGGSEGQFVILFNNGVQVNDEGRPVSVPVKPSSAARQVSHDYSGSGSVFRRASADAAAAVAAGRRQQRTTACVNEPAAAGAGSSTSSALVLQVRSSPISVHVAPLQTAAAKQATSPPLSTRSSHDDVLTYVLRRLPELEKEMSLTSTSLFNANHKTKPKNSSHDSGSDSDMAKNLLRKLYHISSRQGFQPPAPADLNSAALSGNKPPLSMRLANCIRSLEHLKHLWEQEAAKAPQHPTQDSTMTMESTQKNLFDTFGANDDGQELTALRQRDPTTTSTKVNSHESKSMAKSSWNLFGRTVEEGGSNSKDKMMMDAAAVRKAFTEQETLGKENNASSSHGSHSRLRHHEVLLSSCHRDKKYIKMHRQRKTVPVLVDQTQSHSQSQQLLVTRTPLQQHSKGTRAFDDSVSPVTPVPVLMDAPH
jgi:hypothetical protein